MAQDLVESGISEIPEVNINAEIDCAMNTFRVCPRPARWVWYFDCGATGLPICDKHSAEFAMSVNSHMGEECVCIPYEHTHLVSEIKNRRL